MDYSISDLIIQLNRLMEFHVHAMFIVSSVTVLQ